MPYAYALHTIVRWRNLTSPLAKLTAGDDAAWVVAPAVLILGWPETRSTIGKWASALIAVAVADIGLVKLAGWRKR